MVTTILTVSYVAMTGWFVYMTVSVLKLKIEPITKSEVESND